MQPAGLNAGGESRESLSTSGVRQGSVDGRPAVTPQDARADGGSVYAGGPSAERIARARCLVPLLGHVAVRLASLAPIRLAIQDRAAAARRLADSAGQQRGSAGGAGEEDEALAAAEEVLVQSDMMARFAGELTELCGAEGQWLAALALTQKVVQKIFLDFSRLACALEGCASLINGLGQVAAQPSAVAPASPSRPASAGLAPPPLSPGIVSSSTAAGGDGGTGAAGAAGNSVAGGAGNDAARAAASSGTAARSERAGAVLCAMLTTASKDLQADLDEEAFCKQRLAAELIAARELQRWLIVHTEGAVDDAERQLMLERIAHFEGGLARPLASLARELEAAEQFCRVLSGAAPAPAAASRTAGAEGGPRPPGSGRDAPVSEAQASGGSALHRWIRAQVTETRAQGGVEGFSPPGGATGDASGANLASAAGGRPSCVKLADIPHEFLCPITQDVMRDAVSTCDGHTYERRNIEAWLSEKSTSPITGLSLANKALIPNHSLRKLILDSGVLSRLETDATQDNEAPAFRDKVCCEVVVPRDVASLPEALIFGAAQAAQFAVVHGGRVPPFGVRLQPGEHYVPRALQIDQDVEILGDGASVTILRLAAAASLELSGCARLACIAICREANCDGVPLPRVSGARPPALVEVVQGNARIELCDLSNACGSAVRVSGAHTSPTISRNTIHSCRDPSTVFQDGADGVLASNRIFGNRSVAIEVHSRADPLVEDNDVFDGRQGGIFVYNRGKGHLRRNKIFQNALEGVEIKQGGRPLVEDNDIYDNLECGIFVHSGGEGRIIGNRIHSNSYAGIEIKDASSPEVRGNDVYSGRTSGMYVHSGGQGVIEGNHIHQNLLHGVYVRNRGCPHLLKNRVFRNDECGVFVTESSHPCIERNEVHSNGLAGIEVKEDSNPTIKLNRIYNGNTGGVFVLARGRGRIFENKLYKNRLEGVEIKDGGDPLVTDNEIYENMECGVFAHDGALGKIEGNRIFANAYAGVEIKDYSSPLVKGNRIYRGQTSGVYVHSGGQGKVVENDVFENGLHGVMILSGGQPVLVKNKVHDNVECGVVSHVGYVLDTASNQIYSNRVKNVQQVRL